MVYHVKVSQDKEELASRLHDGNSDARAELFYSYFNRLYSLVFYIVSKDRDIAEHITRYTFLNALKLYREVPVEGSLYTWLVRIANQKLIDYYGHLKNKGRMANRAFINTPDIDDSNAEIEFEKALYDLPFHYRQVLLLKYLEKMPVSEISKVMRRTPGAIEGLLTRACKTLEIYT